MSRQGKLALLMEFPVLASRPASSNFPVSVSCRLFDNNSDEHGNHFIGQLKVVGCEYLPAFCEAFQLCSNWFGRCGKRTQFGSQTFQKGLQSR